MINDALGLAYSQVYSDGDRTITIRLRSYRWSEGAPVTTRDIEFALNLYRAGEADIVTYVPGEFPDNIESVDYPSSTVFVLHLKHAYSQQWYTDNQRCSRATAPSAARSGRTSTTSCSTPSPVTPLRSTRSSTARSTTATSPTATSGSSTRWCREASRSPVGAPLRGVGRDRQGEPGM